MSKSKRAFKWNEVTPFSKYLAMALFVLLPIASFIFGVKYHSSYIKHLQHHSFIAVEAKKTYSNSTFGIAFEYPETWVYGEDKSGINRPGSNIYLHPETQSRVDAKGEINIWITNNNTSLEEYITEHYCVDSKPCYALMYAGFVEIGGTKAYLLQNLGGVLPSDKIVFKHNEQIIEIHFNYNGVDKFNYQNKDSRRVFEEVVSSFKLLER